MDDLVNAKHHLRQKVGNCLDSVHAWERWCPKRRFEAIAVMATEGHPVQVVLRVLGVSESGFCAWRDCGPSARSVRHVLLIGTIRQIHAVTGGVSGVRRGHTA
ncbi:hypothetical protein ABZ234_24950 [Nocardiopsis sp. NPDC006198]|uniref:hypothetical protein n=1 Tax=Nocardiopsis sp. NPDC006198 TaxID=3154472 RepID=UPI0033A88348